MIQFAGQQEEKLKFGELFCISVLKHYTTPGSRSVWNLNLFFSFAFLTNECGAP